MFLSKILDISTRKGAKFNKIISDFVQIWQKMISLVTMATNIDSKLLTIVFLFLVGTEFHPIPNRSVPGPFLNFLVVTEN